MSEFDLTMRAAMQDDSLFYDLLEMARNKGQSLQEFFISLGRKELQHEHSDTETSAHQEHERQVMAEQVWVSFWKQRAVNPKGFDAAVSASLRGLNIPDMSGEELREWALD